MLAAQSHFYYAIEGANIDDEQEKQGVPRRSTVVLGDIQPSKQLQTLLMLSNDKKIGARGGGGGDDDDDGDIIMSEINSSKTTTGCLAKASVTIRWLAAEEEEEEEGGLFCDPDEDGCGNTDASRFQVNASSGDTTCNNCSLFIKSGSDRREPAVVWTDISDMLQNVPLLSHFSGLVQGSGACSNTDFWHELSSYYCVLPGA